MRPPVIREAQCKVARFRQALHTAGFAWSDDERVDLDTICEVLLSCPIIALPRLTDRAALRHLSERFSFPEAEDGASDDALAGALYVSDRGVPRWIFVESADRPQRQRFTVAHEIGHLVIEAEPKIAQTRATNPSMFDSAAVARVIRYSRCPASALALGEAGAARRRSWSADDLREIAANHFAAELLMPLEGVRRVIARTTDPLGPRSDHDVERVVTHVAEAYDVSLACARTHIVRDLGIVPPTRDLNADLFA